MSLSITPAPGAVAQDRNEIPLTGGLNADGSGDVLTLELIPGANPNQGAILVSTPPSGAPAFVVKPSPIALVGPVAAPLALVSTPIKSAVFRNDDGAMPVNGNTDVIWIGDATVAPGLSGYPLRLNEAIGFDISDLADLWAVSASPAQVLTMGLVGV